MTSEVRGEAERFWEGLYRGRPERPWDGGANPLLVEVAGSLPAGTALDLGCGEGSDALWSWNRDPDQRFPTPEETLALLDLDPGRWRTERLGRPEREASGPNGQTATVADNVVAVRRLAP